MKKLVGIGMGLILILGCSDTTEDGSGTNSIGGNQDEPVGVQLVFPFEDSLCNEGTDLTPTESTVFFEWDPNDNAQSYTLTVENLGTGTITQFETEDFILPVTIQRAQAFRWSVHYEVQGDTKESALWNFFNAGPGVETYPPFPAQIIAPAMAESLPATTATVVLQWDGSDVDEDIVAYDVYFGTNTSPALVASDIAINQFTVSVVSGTIYYWNIVTKDDAGHSSESGIHQFRILD